MNQVFKIFPSIGYRNTQFQIVGFEDNLTIQIEQEGQPQILIELPQNKKAVIKKINSPGQYFATCNVNGVVFKQTIEVKDAIRLGTSELKTAFTFDQIPYLIFLMRDRMLIYDETEKVLREENEISPSDIKKIDDGHLLLITKLENVTTKKVITNYGIYSVLNFAIVAELLSNYIEIFHNQKGNTLWLYNDSEFKIICFDLKTINDGKLKIIEEVDSIKSYSLNKLGSHIFTQSDKTIFIINIKTAKIKTFEKKTNVSFDEDGNYFVLKNDLLNCTNLLIETSNQINCHVPINLNVNSNRFFFLGDDFKTIDINTEFANTISEIEKCNIPKLDNSKKYQYIFKNDDIELIEEKFSYELFPSENGIHLVVEKATKKFRGIKYNKDKMGVWNCNPDIITSISYSLIHSSLNKTINLIESSNNLRICGYFELLLIIVDDYHETKFIKSDEIIRKIESINDYSFIACNKGTLKYLLEKTDNNYNVFSSTNFKMPILKSVQILNFDLIEKHSVIWYVGSQKDTIQNLHYLQGYNTNTGKQIFIADTTIKHSRYKDAKEIIFKEKYFLSSNNVLVNPLSFEIKDASFGTIINTSNSLNKVITRRDEIIYLLKFDSNSKKYSEELIEINIQKNNESYFSPDGKYLMLQKQPNQYVYYDIESDEEKKFFTEKFVAFSKEGNLIFEGDTSKNAKIIDPLTFDNITPLNYHYYRFLSPDGKLYSQTSTKIRYYDKIQECTIDVTAVLKFQYQFDVPNELYFDITDQGKHKLEVFKIKINLNRKEYFEVNKIKLNQIGIEDYEKVGSLRIIRVDKFTEIGIVGTNIKVEIDFPKDLKYYNYACFSYCNKYFGYVGKPQTKGLIHLYKLNFNEDDNTLEVIDSHLSRYPSFASWVCGFSKGGYFGTYDSTPDTYILKVDAEFFERKTSDENLGKSILRNDRNIYCSYKKWNVIKNKNFLCFSPSGNFISLSEQGYEPLSLGGSGHQESSTVHIAKTINGEIVDSFFGHGDIIKIDKNKNVVFVAFSEDEKQIMSMSTDGVVIIRQIKLNHSNKIETIKSDGVNLKDYNDVNSNDYSSGNNNYGGAYGYDDDTIDSAFEGDPENYWNID